MFSPHPDDECIVGALPLRLLREGLRVVNVAVTQGSRKERRHDRWDELNAACEYLGFEVSGTTPGGLENISLETRSEDPGDWDSSVGMIAMLIGHYRPAVVFCPHDADWNSTHVGTHHLVMDALARQPAACTCAVVETEFWGAMATPNLMVEVAPEELADLVAALSFHVGEVQRNPYHLRLPAWMMDNVRRGGELVGGQGAAAPDFTFATLYRMRRWKDGRMEDGPSGGQVLAAGGSARELLLTKV